MAGCKDHQTNDTLRSNQSWNLAWHSLSWNSLQNRVVVLPLVLLQYQHHPWVALVWYLYSHATCTTSMPLAFHDT